MKTLLIMILMHGAATTTTMDSAKVQISKQGYAFNYVDSNLIITEPKNGLRIQAHKTDTGVYFTANVLFNYNGLNEIQTCRCGLPGDPRRAGFKRFLREVDRMGFDYVED